MTKEQFNFIVTNFITQAKPESIEAAKTVYFENLTIHFAAQYYGLNHQSLRKIINRINRLELILNNYPNIQNTTEN